MLTGSRIVLEEDGSSGGRGADVLVIGAGVAGLAAAAELRANGYIVTILEGRKRLGGRLLTDRSWMGIPVELGASWIHGVKNNPVAELAKRWEIASSPFDYDSRVLYDAAGKWISVPNQLIYFRK